MAVLSSTVLSQCWYNSEAVFLCSGRGVVQMARMLAWGASGRWFESSHPDKRAIANEEGAGREVYSAKRRVQLARQRSRM